MDEWTEGRVQRVSRLWTETDDEGRELRVWLAVFDLAPVRGRIECVGFALRSATWDSSAVAPLLDEAGVLDTGTPEGKLIDDLMAWVDPLPAEVDADVLQLQPLTYTTLRRFRFKEELLKARTEEADTLQAAADMLRAMVLNPKGVAAALGFGAGDSPERLDPEHASRLSGLADDLETRGEAVGRAPRIVPTPDLLEHVARIYQHAWREGLIPPSTAVETELSRERGSRVTPDQARGLVRKCRAADPPLLPPTEAREARGWLRDDPGIPAWAAAEWSVDSDPPA